MDHVLNDIYFYHNKEIEFLNLQIFIKLLAFYLNSLSLETMGKHFDM